MDKWKCYRCGYRSRRRTDFIRHLRRKYPCHPKLSEISVEDVFRHHFSNTSRVNNTACYQTLSKVTPNDSDRLFLTPIDSCSISRAKVTKPKKTYACAGCSSQFSKNSNLCRHERKCPEKKYVDDLKDLDKQMAIAERKVNFREVASLRQVHKNRTNNNTRVPKPLRKQVWLKRNGNVIEGKCYVCIGAISYDTFESGHVKAASTGGETTLQNLEPICKTCNNDMGIEDLEQFKKVWYQQHDQHKSSGVQGH